MVFVCGENINARQKTKLYCFTKDKGKWIKNILAENADFYVSPKISPDTTRIAWIEWQEGYMPWENAQLMLAELDFNPKNNQVTLKNIKKSLSPPCFQPCWTKSNLLYVVQQKQKTGQIVSLNPQNMETKTLTPMIYDALQPIWGLETRSFCVLENDNIIATLHKQEKTHLLHIDNNQQKPTITRIDLDFADIEMVCSFKNNFCAIIHSEAKPPQCCMIKINKDKKIVKKIVCKTNLATEKIKLKLPNPPPNPQFIKVKIEGQICHAIYYPPCKVNSATNHDELPPVIMSFHGGPAGRAARGFRPKIYYWLLHGIGFIDIDYFGSTGYGYDYRQKIYHRWGELEAKSAVIFANYLIQNKLADENKLAIYGASSGGFSALATICKTSIFKAATIAYGISDLARLYDTSNRFEKDYILNLIGADKKNPYEKLKNASPIHKAEKIKTATLFLQGSKDPIVPSEQARNMVKTLRSNNEKSYYFEFEGAGHGFSEKKHKRTALLAEHEFYRKIIGYPKIDTRFQIDDEQTMI